MIYVTMVYGPIAAMLVELFPTRIRYTSMSLPYHIGNGWFGGLLPSVTLRDGGAERQHVLRPLVPDRRSPPSASSSACCSCARPRTSTSTPATERRRSSLTNGPRAGPFFMATTRVRGESARPCCGIDASMNTARRCQCTMVRHAPAQTGGTAAAARGPQDARRGAGRVLRWAGRPATAPAAGAGMAEQDLLDDDLRALDQVAEERGAAALPALQAAVERMRDEGDRDRLVWALPPLARAYALCEKFDEAEAAANEALAHFRVNGSVRGQAFALNALGVVAIRRGVPSRALEVAGEAVVLARAAEDPILQVRIANIAGRRAQRHRPPARGRADLRGGPARRARLPGRAGRAAAALQPVARPRPLGAEGATTSGAPESVWRPRAERALELMELRARRPGASRSSGARSAARSTTWPSRTSCWATWRRRTRRSTRPSR